MNEFTEKNNIGKAFPWFLFILSLGFAFRIVFLNASLQSDDTTYFVFASNLSADLFKNAYHQAPFRLGILVPLAVLQKIFGYSLVSYYSFSLGSSLFLLVMIYWVGFKIGGLQTALFSGLLFSCSFFGLNQTTNVLPDVPNLALLLASFLAFIYVTETRGRTHVLLLFLATFLGFCSYLVRAPNLVFLLAIPVYELLIRRSLKFTILFSIIFSILWLSECCFYQVVADDFFLRIKMIPKGSTLWVKYMPELSWQAYLQEPITRLSQSFSGIIILWGGLAGSIIAIWKKNHGMIALLTGALLLFVVYSYSVTSVSPLRRALPLNVRYIVAFTAVMTIATGYALSSLKPTLGKMFSANIVSFISGCLLVFLMGLQVQELPRKLPNTVFFKDSSYFLADQLLENIDLPDLKEKVYAYPVKDFKMYPNFSKLKVMGMAPDKVPDGTYFLYSRKRVQVDLSYGWYGKDKETEQKLQTLLLPKHPGWKYLINTKDIVLAYIPSFALKHTNVMALDGSFFLRHWGMPKDVFVKQIDNATSFHFDKREKPFYIYTFPGTFSRPPDENIDIFDSLEPGKVYELKIQYRIQEKLKNLGITFSQYDDTKRNASTAVNAPSTAGSHVFTKLVVTSKEYKKFRLFFRITNKKASNKLKIEKISFNLISE